MIKLAIRIALLLCLTTTVTAEMFKIENPASNIYNPASHMDEPNPLSPPTQPVPPSTVKETTTIVKPDQVAKPAEQLREQPYIQSQTKQVIYHKRYQFKSVRAYISAANKAYKHGDYNNFLSITEDALRRIRTGTLKASNKSKQILNKYKDQGHRLLNR